MSVSEFLQMLPVCTGTVGDRDPLLGSSLPTGRLGSGHLGLVCRISEEAQPRDSPGLPRAVIFKVFAKLRGL